MASRRAAPDFNLIWRSFHGWMPFLTLTLIRVYWVLWHKLRVLAVQSYYLEEVALISVLWRMVFLRTANCQIFHSFVISSTRITVLKSFFNTAYDAFLGLPLPWIPTFLSDQVFFMVFNYFFLSAAFFWGQSFSPTNFNCYLHVFFFNHL